VNLEEKGSSASMHFVYQKGKHEILARNFAPLYGIDEEAATGTSNGALACFLMKHMKDECDSHFIIERG
jgi:predicted PhzF superfamily epimerase YddE/YHI9